MAGTADQWTGLSACRSAAAPLPPAGLLVGPPASLLVGPSNRPARLPCAPACCHPSPSSSRTTWASTCAARCGSRPSSTTGAGCGARLWIGAGAGVRWPQAPLSWWPCGAACPAPCTHVACCSCACPCSHCFGSRPPTAQQHPGGRDARGPAVRRHPQLHGGRLLLSTQNKWRSRCWPGLLADVMRVCWHCCRSLPAPCASFCWGPQHSTAHGMSTGGSPWCAPVAHRLPALLARPCRPPTLCASWASGATSTLPPWCRCGSSAEVGDAPAWPVCECMPAGRTLPAPAPARYPRRAACSPRRIHVPSPPLPGQVQEADVAHEPRDRARPAAPGAPAHPDRCARLSAPPVHSLPAAARLQRVVGRLAACSRRGGSGSAGQGAPQPNLQPHRPDHACVPALQTLGGWCMW